jgi:hypothetical protein
MALCNDTVEKNLAEGGSGSLPGQGFGGGIYIVAGATVYIDSFTVAHTVNNSDNSGTSRNAVNIDGSITLKNC